MNMQELVKTLAGVHSPEKCKGRHCCIHNPSNHHMLDWPVIWRDDKGQMERICKHGVGHPDPDDADYWDSIGQGYRNIHGCCGCCYKEGVGNVR